MRCRVKMKQAQQKKNGIYLCRLKVEWDDHISLS